MAACAKPAPAPALPKTVRTGCHGEGSLIYTTGVAFADVVSKYTPMKMIAAPTPGPTAWLPLMRKGEVEFGICADTDAYEAYHAERAFKEKTNLLVVKVGVSLVKVSLLLRADSGIKTVQDLQGKKVAYGCPGRPSADWKVEAVLINGGLTPDDIVAVPYESLGQGIKLVIEGKADAALSSVGHALSKELEASPHGAYFMPLNPDPGADVLKKMDDVLPGVYMATVEPGPAGIDQSTTLMTWNMYLLAYADVSDDVVYAIAKALYEHFDELKPVHPSMPAWSPEGSATEAVIPFHPGAIKFYKEIGIWKGK